tara:strand:- start:103 stop:303 length:201 start_codon:yes stop_codon:yes gene_type:complete
VSDLPEAASLLRAIHALRAAHHPSDGSKLFPTTLSGYSFLAVEERVAGAARMPYQKRNATNMDVGR